MDAVMAHHRKVPRTASYHWIKERSAALMKEINYIALMRDACSSGQVSNPQSTYPEASPETGLCRTSLLHTCRPLFSPSAIAMQPPAVATHSQQQHTKRRSLEQEMDESSVKASRTSPGKGSSRLPDVSHRRIEHDSLLDEHPELYDDIYGKERSRSLDEGDALSVAQAMNVLLDHSPGQHVKRTMQQTMLSPDKAGMIDMDEYKFMLATALIGVAHDPAETCSRRQQISPTIWNLSEKTVSPSSERNSTAVSTLKAQEGRAGGDADVPYMGAIFMPMAVS